MEKQESRLAKLAALGHETEAEFEARMQKRAQRIAHKIEGWDRDNLAERYAWMLLLACELRKTCRVMERRGDFHQHLEYASQFRAKTMERITHDAMLEVMKGELDRKRGAAAKLANDPKQKAKVKAFELWQDWQTGKALHKSGAAFARHVMNKLPDLENQKTIERWVTHWRREAKAKK